MGTCRTIDALKVNMLLLEMRGKNLTDLMHSDNLHLHRVAGNGGSEEVELKDS